MLLPSSDQPSSAGSSSKVGASSLGAVPSDWSEITCTRICRLQVAGTLLTEQARYLPSGENTGLASAASVAGRGRSVPVATVTSQTSAVGQSSGRDDLSRVKAICLPSGDQLKLPTAVRPEPTWKSAPVSLVTGYLPPASFAR